MGDILQQPDGLDDPAETGQGAVPAVLEKISIQTAQIAGRIAAIDYP
jgi:hypothetical protein